jgi:chorismate mutase
MSMSGPPPNLEDIRKEIDAIDDGIADLVARRIAASLQVRQNKAADGSISQSPIRPAREAAILRRLLTRSAGAVPPDLLVRLWRVILSSSTLAQAEVSLHVPKRLAASAAAQRVLSAHFGAMPIADYRDEAQAMVQVNLSPGDLCVVEMGSSWAEAFVSGAAGEARVIGVLPVLRAEDAPAYVILGHAAAQPTGDDETLVISTGKLPRDFAPAPLWQARSGVFTISSLPGFLSDREGGLAALLRSNAALSLRVAGQIPSQIEVS